MKRILFLALASVVIMCPRGFAQKIKEPNVSGQFYDADPGRLLKHINSFLSQAQVTPSDKNIQILISPHAGYVYSGPVAAYSYKAISQKSYKTVVIIAVSHYYGFDGAAVWPEGGFRTPLGVVEVDSDFANKLLAADPKFVSKPQAFEQEHSLEVQIPFLQAVLKDFKIVPVIMGQTSFATVQRLADVLDSLISAREDVLVVASSDMSHYHSGDVAKEMDQSTLKMIEQMDLQGFWEQCSLHQKEMCGFVPVTTVMLLAQKRGLKPEVLRYANSGDVVGDYSRVVGYGSVIFYKEAGTPDVKKDENLKTKNQEIPALSEEQKKALLVIARTTVTQYVRDRKVFEPKTSDPRLQADEGAFVTLRKKGALRGCIGNIVGRGPLYLTVRDMAIAASSEDPRFNPVTASELGDIDLEVSVLSKPRRATSPEEIQMGVHGVIVRRGFNQGVFLPQVATETGWTREQFLSNLCSHKAGLAADAWKDPQTILEIFSAEVFSENDVPGMKR